MDARMHDGWEAAQRHYEGTLVVKAEREKFDVLMVGVQLSPHTSCTRLRQDAADATGSP
jgi:hypothetical protein